MVVTKQRMGLSKALEEPKGLRGAEQAMQSVFWCPQQGRAQVRPLRAGAWSPEPAREPSGRWGCR